MSEKVKVKSFLFKHFLKKDDSTGFICQCKIEKDGEVKSCGDTFSSKTYNLKRYLERCHPKEYEDVVKKDSEAFKTVQMPKLRATNESCVTKIT